MRYLTTKKIGKYEIISGVGTAPIDPELTKNAIEKPLKASKEWSTLFELGQQKFKLLDKVLVEKRQNEYIKLRQKLNEIEQKILSADQEFLKKRKKLYNTHAVYSKPAGGIMVDSDKKIELLDKFTRSNGNFIAVDGKIVSRETLEKSEIECLDEDTKNNRKQHELTLALSESVKMKNELEVTGDPDAVKKSMDYYNGKKQQIAKKYGE